MDHTKFQQYEQRALGTVYQEEQGGFHDDIIPQLAQRFLPDMVPDRSARILDIGCGPGVFIRAARDLGYLDVTGVTLSPEDHAACVDHGLRAVVASMTDLPDQDQSIDLIWCRHALEHSPYPLFTLYEFHRVLRAGGSVFVEVPAPDNERAYMHEFNPNHYSILGQRMWAALFEKAGFTMQGFWNYEVSLPFDQGPYAGKTVVERSYLFAIARS